LKELQKDNFSEDKALFEINLRIHESDEVRNLPMVERVYPSPSKNKIIIVT
jgi:hypothetical protein